MDKNTVGSGTPSALAGSLAKTLEGLSLELIQAEVFMVYPALGTYLLIPKMGEVTGTLSLACSLSGSVGRSGVRGSHVYEAGDQVLVAQYKLLDNPLNIDGRSITYIGYILSAAPPDFMATAQGYPGSNIHSTTLDVFKETMTDAFASTKELEDTLRDISYGSPNDVFAGDMYEHGPLNTFLTVCASKTAIGASPMAMVEAFTFHDKVRITARNVEDRSTTVESGREIDEDAVNYYRRLAISESEGLGVAPGGPAPMKEADDGTLELVEEEAGQLGIFRHTGLAGKIADGEIEAVLRPVEEGEIHTAESPEDAPVGMVSVRKTYDGRHETRAAGGIDHVKSLFIPVPEQTKAHDAEAFDASPEAVEAYERRSAAELGGAFSPFAAAEEATEFDEDTAQTRNSVARSREEYWRTLSREDLEEHYPGVEVEDAPRKLDPLGDADSFYEEPPSVQVTDPVTELQRKVYALESIIRQQPDGTVVISDGHGSEIRMYRGRISISPAADLELRPGRDCYELVPRKKVVNAGEEVQIVSNEGKVRIKAETDMDIMAANNNEGRILIETRSPELAEPEKTGVHIKTQASLHMTGEDIYMGLNPPEDVEEGAGGFARENRGTIAIDARQGQIGMMGETMYCHMRNEMTLSSTGSVFGLQGNNATLIANTGLLGVGTLQMSTIKGAAQVPRGYFASGGQEEDFIEAPQNPTLKLDGDILATGSVLINGVVAAESVNAKNGAFENADPDSSGLYTAVAYNPNIKIEPFNAKAIASSSGKFLAAVPQLWGDAGLLGAHFEFDKPPNVSTENFEMQLMRWQLMLSAGGNDVTWAQKPVKDIDNKDTYAYPGHGPDTTEAGPINAGKLGKKPFNGYIVNKKA